MKKKNIFEFLFLLCFILNFVLLIMKKLLFLMTFGLLFIMSTRFKNSFDIEQYYRKKHGNYKVGNFQKKIYILQGKEVNIVFLVVGFSMCIWYIFILLIKEKLVSYKFMLGVVLPLNVLLPILFMDIYHLILLFKFRRHRLKYNIKVLAQCINVEESICYPENSSTVSYSYIVTYQFYYNNNIYTVSNLYPKSYLNVPLLGNNYEIMINKDDPGDFLDDNVEEKKNVAGIVITLAIKLIMLSTLVYVWIKYY